MCEQVVCGQVVCGGGGGRKEEEEEAAEAAGYRTKNKNPTQRCGEQWKIMGIMMN